MAGSDDFDERSDPNTTLRVQVDELERLRTRAVADIGELRTALQKRNDAFRDLSLRHDELTALFALASEQLDGMAERGTLQWLRPSDSEARMRSVAAEHTLHEFLIGFADEVVSIADKPGAVLLVGELRSMTAVILEQLELTQNELALVTERLTRYERYSLSSRFHRIFESNAIKKLRRRLRRR